MDALNTLVSLITCRSLNETESNKMTEAIIKIREHIQFSINEKNKQKKREHNEMMMLPCNR